MWIPWGTLRSTNSYLVAPPLGARVTIRAVPSLGLALQGSPGAVSFPFSSCTRPAVVKADFIYTVMLASAFEDKYSISGWSGLLLRRAWFVLGVLLPPLCAG